MQVRAVAMMSALFAACGSPTSESSMAVPGFTVGGGDGGTGGGAADAGSAGCGFELSGFEQHEGQRARLKVYPPGQPVLAKRGSVVITKGQGQLIVQGLGPNTTFTADFFVDTNSDGACSPCGTSIGEHAWRSTCTTPDDGLLQTSTFPHTTAFTDISPF